MLVGCGLFGAPHLVLLVAGEVLGEVAQLVHSQSWPGGESPLLCRAALLTLHSAGTRVVYTHVLAACMKIMHFHHGQIASRCYLL